MLYAPGATLADRNPNDSPVARKVRNYPGILKIP